MPRLLSVLVLAALALAPAALVPRAAAQDSLDVTFRFVPDLTQPPIAPVVRAYLPGSFNDWGPNSGGQIAVSAPSQMDYFAPLVEYRKAVRLRVGGGSVPGGGYTYKVHYHRNASGSEYTWIPDPLGTETFGPNDDTIVRVTDPMAFQLAREENAEGEVAVVGAGIFGTEAITSIAYTVNATTYTDGLGYYDAASGIFRRALPEPVPPGSFLRVTATDALGRTAEASVGLIPPVVEDAPVPAGLADGINYAAADPTRATLVLRAPGKSYVHLLGAFNGWAPAEGYVLRRDAADPLGTRWWMELTGLAPGVETPFQYLVDGGIRTADPYTEKVVYPGQTGFPSGAGQFPVGILKTAATPFPWTDAGWVRPPQEDLVIYELIVRDFLAAHSYTALTDTLDYLQRLGVNAIELMPVSEFDGDQSWGYNPAFWFAPDKYYGTADQLRAFVDACHARGMAVILDVVYNHATGQSPFVRLYNQGDFGPPTAENPWFNVTATHPFNVFNDVNHASPLTQLWLDRVNRHWIEEYHEDGYRFDLSGGFMQTGSFFGYNAGRVAILERMMGELYAHTPDAYVILEHLIESGDEWRRLAAFGEAQGWPGPVLWHNMSREYSQSAMGYPTATDFPSALTATYTPNWAGGVPVPNVVTYMESHDEQWMMFRNRTYGNQNAQTGYSIRDLNTALERQKLAGVFFFTVPGPRMLWQFGELGYGWGPNECLVNGDYPGECPNGVPGRVDAKPIRWDYWAPGVAPVPSSLPAASDEERVQRQRLYKAWAALMNLRADYAVFRSPETQVQLRLGLTPDRWIKLALPSAPEGEPRQALIFGNFGVSEATVTLTFPEAVTWYDFFEDTEAGYPAGTHTLALQPGEFHVWTDVDVPSPEPDIVGVGAEDGAPADGPLAFGLGAAFPNPATGSTTIPFALDRPGPARLDVFDVLGRRVATLLDGPMGAGPHRAGFETGGLPSGVYVVRLTAGERVAARRLTVAR